MNRSPKEILKGLEEYREDLIEILGAIYNENLYSPEPDKLRDKLRTWEQLFIKFLKNNGLERQAQEFTQKLPTDVNYPDEELVDRLDKSHLNYIDCLIHGIRRHPQEILSQDQGIPPYTGSGKNSSREAIISILGHYKDELGSFIDKFQSETSDSMLIKRTNFWLKRVAKFLEDNGYLNEAKFLLENPIEEWDMPSWDVILNEYIPFLDSLTFQIQHSPTKNRLTKKEAESFGVLGNKVFIVHGHDKANLYELRDLLKDKFGLESIILFKEAAKGRTIIKKFEDEAPNAGYAFILMTPDDQVIPPGKKKIEYAQARPNVFFELGWFCRRLGREKICILFKKGTKIHSDFEGIERAEFNNSVEEVVLKIEKELRAAELI